MTLTTASLRTKADAVCANDGVDLGSMARRDLLDFVSKVEAVRKAADVLMAQAAAEVDQRSRPEDGHAGLAGREGFRSAKELLAHRTGGSLADADRLVRAGGLLADAGGAMDAEAGGEARAEIGDEGGTEGQAAGEHAQERVLGPIEQVKAEVATRVREGSIRVDVATLLVGALEDVPDTERSRDLFVKALDKASGLALHQVRKIVWRAQALADPDAWKVREDQQYQARAVTIRDGADGMVTLTATLTPLMAAPIKAVLDAGVRRAMQERRDQPGSDERSPWQMRADLFTDMCRHMLDCDKPTSGVKTTVVVRIGLEELTSGVGMGEIDGSAQPVSASVLRQAAADAQVIPAVLGGASEVLDWGRAQRLYTPAQRLALVERDGGCAWCNAPPSWCEAHHIKWWCRDFGPTDLENGVLLCTRCHHRVHRDGWDIEVRPPDRESTDPGSGSRGKSGHGSTVWFIPPRSVDPARTPQMGGRAKYDLREEELKAS